MMLFFVSLQLQRLDHRLGMRGVITFYKHFAVF